MPDKFIIHGAAFNGDGTASNEAASAGAPGAWNNINIITGTAPAFGTLAAGDVVYIRSKTSAGADITFANASYTLGSTAATAAAQVTWILDNGSIWAGINGTMTIGPLTEWNGVTLRAYNALQASSADRITISTTGGNRFVQLLYTQRMATTKNLYLDVSSCIATIPANNESTMACDGGVHEAIRVRRSALPQDRGVFSSNFNQYNEGSGALFLNPTVELTQTGSANTGAVFQSPSSSVTAGGNITVIGGSCSGVGASEGFIGLSRLGGGSGSISVFGFAYPKNMPTLSASAHPAHASGATQCSVVGADNGYGSFTGSPTIGEFDSRNLLYNYPTLNAAVPDTAATPWSWRGVPRNGVKTHDPMSLKLAALYTDTPGAKTMTLEMLVSDTVASVALNNYNVWIVVSYVENGTNAYKTQTTRANFGQGTSIPSSSATWSALTWGVVNLNRRKLALTTTTAIKQNTMVFVTLFWTIPSAAPTDMFFVCPAVQLT